MEEVMMKLLVITSCTGEKKVCTEAKLLQEDFKSRDVLSQKEQSLRSLSLPAKDMYTGLQHLQLMEGINKIRNHFGNHAVDL